MIQFPAQWSFLLPKASIILVSDQQLDELTDPDKEIDLSLSSAPTSAVAVAAGRFMQLGER